jgi:hypothetical protein
LCAAWSPVASAAIGVFQGADEPQSLSDMRRADARSRQYGRPAGVTLSFQVRENKVEPTVANRRFNLLAKHSVRSRLFDELEPCGP